MKQVTQRLRDGRIEVLDVPPPALTPETVLIDVRASLMSVGTERTKVETAQRNLLGKARARPDQVRQVIEKAQRDGLRETIDAVRSRLDQPSGLGYSAAGVVQAVGARVPDLVPGDRVACGGAGYAEHAEVDRVPGNLCVPAPAAVPFEEAAFATVGSIALHGVRQAEAALGERIAVIGLGLVGQLVAQLLRAAGCTVVGIDLSPQLVDRASELGSITAAYARSALDSSRIPSDAAGCDAVIITAATGSDDPIELAAALCRDRGRVVVVGDVGMTLPRSPYYAKELQLRLSRSYGPGRYDSAYEQYGLDYPIGYVRWTERRNMAAFLELVATGKVDVASLITARVPVAEAADAYADIASAERSPLGVVIEYEANPEYRDDRLPVRPQASKASALGAGVIGAGSFAQRVLIPSLARAGFELIDVASASGLTARSAADRFGFERATSPEQLIGDPDVGLVVIATRHASHASLAIDALRYGNAVFVEKPPAVSIQELRRLEAVADDLGRRVFVGFNRRHAPLAEALRQQVTSARQPIELLYRVNAGPLPAGHWLDDIRDGGGRLIGEGCHFVDFACWIVGALPTQVSCLGRAAPGEPLATAARFSIVLSFPEGSLATIDYFEGGAGAVPKEYVEAHAAGRSGVLDDFRRLTLFDGRRSRRQSGRRQDKGHRQQLVRLKQSLGEPGEGPSPDPLKTMAVTFAALEAMETGEVVTLAGDRDEKKGRISS
jgi:predicted dehydrogenase/threonine dehydrogenase-like Zn-dependent dehydrogenase